MIDPSKLDKLKADVVKRLSAAVGKETIKKVQKDGWKIIAEKTQSYRQGCGKTKLERTNTDDPRTGHIASDGCSCSEEGDRERTA